MDIFHDIRNRNLLEKCPDGIPLKDWAKFRDDYHSANRLLDIGYPVQIDIELNSTCNMKCPFCIHGYSDRAVSSISFDTYKQIIDEAVSLGVRGLKMNYLNEPMLRKDLEAHIKYAKNAGMLNIYMTTNGTLLNKSRREQIIDSGITKIFISIDAATSGTYDKQRLSGKFDKVVSNVIELVKERNRRGLDYPLIRVSFLRNKINLSEEQAFFDYWKDRVDMVAFQKMNDLPDTDSGITIKEDTDTDYRCSFPFKQLVVDSEGDILPCCKMGGKELALGNIKSMSLREAWGSDKAKSIRSMHERGAWRENKVCTRCILG
jgi:radical SAM protein with 4Fe4S-binding SPASM domain